MTAQIKLKVPVPVIKTVGVMTTGGTWYIKNKLNGREESYPSYAVWVLYGDYITHALLT